VRRYQQENTLFFVGLACLVGAVLALPVFPSGDGPVHVYLAHVLFVLAAHSGGSKGGGFYGRVYLVRHLVQPYSLHYLWLIGFGQFVPVVVAEKLFVAAILVVNALGFRFLLRQLGGSAAAVSMWILPLLLSWALGSGFFNFCFAAGMLFFAYGLYLRAGRKLGAGVIALYVLVLLLLVLSHPVPLLLLLLLLGGDWALLGWSRRGVGVKPSLAVPGLFLGLALVAFVFPILIADKGSVAESLLRDLRPHLAQVAAIASGDRLSLFFSGSAEGILFTAVLVALGPVGIWLLARHGAVGRLRAGLGTEADRLGLVALAVLLGTIVFPESMNGSALFADRMVPLLWPLLFAGAAAVPFPKRLRGWSTALAAAATVGSLGFVVFALLPASREQQALLAAPLPHGARGLFVAAPVVRRPFREHLAGTLLGWGGARVFAADEDVLLNTPWMQLTIVPVGERPGGGLLRDTLPGSLSEDPVALGRWLQSRSPESAAALGRTDFVLVSAPAVAAADLPALVTSYLPLERRDWQCELKGFYAVCVRHNAS
jgi:hypothetical protein